MVRKALYLDLSNKDRVRLKRKKGIFLARWDAADQRTKNQLHALFIEFPALKTAYELKERVLRHLRMPEPPLSGP